MPGLKICIYTTKTKYAINTIQETNIQSNAKKLT